MIANPKPGRRVQVWYRKDRAPYMPWHGKLGVVEIASRGKPRNHGIRMEAGELVVVPCGNLREPQ